MVLGLQGQSYHRPHYHSLLLEPWLESVNSQCTHFLELYHICTSLTLSRLQAMTQQMTCTRYFHLSLSRIFMTPQPGLPQSRDAIFLSYLEWRRRWHPRWPDWTKISWRSRTCSRTQDCIHTEESQNTAWASCIGNREWMGQSRYRGTNDFLIHY